MEQLYSTGTNSTRLGKSWIIQSETLTNTNKEEG